MATLGELIVKIGADARGLAGGLNDSTKQLDKWSKQANKSIGPIMDKIGNGLKVIGVAAAAGFGALTVGSVKGASSLEGYRNTLNVVMKDQENAAETMAWAIDFANKTPFETDSIVEATVRLSAYGLEAQKVMPAVGDMAAVMNKDIMQAVEAVADAQTGELERLKEFGITKAKIVEHNNKIARDKQIVNNQGQITDQEQFNKALFSLMEERFKGGMEIQANSLKGLWSTVTGVFKTTIATLAGISATGEVQVGGLFDSIKNKIKLVVDKLNEWQKSGQLQEWASKAQTALISFWNVGEKVFGGLVSTGKLIVDHWNIIGPILAGVLAGFLAFQTVTAIINTVKTSMAALNLVMAANPISLMVLGIGALIAIGVLLYQNWDTIKTKAIEIWESIKSYFTEVFGKIVEDCSKAWNEFKDSILKTWDNIKTKITEIWGSIKNFFLDVWDSIKAIFNSAFNVIGPIIDSGWKAVQFVTAAVWEAIKTYFVTAWEVIKTIFAAAFLIIYDLVTGRWDEIEEVFSAAWDRIKSLIADAWDNVKKVWKDAFNAIVDFAYTYWDTIKKLFSAAWEAIKSGASSAWRSIEQFFSDGWNAIKQGVNDGWTAVEQFFAYGWSNLKNSAYAGMQTVRDTIVTLWNSVITFFKGLPAQALQWGKDIIEGLWNGISCMGDWLYNNVTGFIKDNLVGVAKRILGIASPSTVMAEYGKNIVEGLAGGVNASANLVSNEMVTLLDAVKNKCQEVINAVTDLQQQVADNPITIPVDIDWPTTGGGGSGGSGVPSGGIVPPPPSGQMVPPPAGGYGDSVTDAGGWDNFYSRINQDVRGYASGGLIQRPVLMLDLATGQPAGVAGEAGEEAIVPMGGRQALAGAGTGDIIINVTGNTFLNYSQMEQFVNRELMPKVAKLFRLKMPVRY